MQSSSSIGRLRLGRRQRELQRAQFAAKERARVVGSHAARVNLLRQQFDISSLKISPICVDLHPRSFNLVPDRPPNVREKIGKVIGGGAVDGFLLRESGHPYVRKHIVQHALLARSDQVEYADWFDPAEDFGLDRPSRSGKAVFTQEPYSGLLALPGNRG